MGESQEWGLSGHVQGVGLLGWINPRLLICLATSACTEGTCEMQFFGDLLIGHRQKQNLDPLLIVVTSKQGLPKFARLAQIYPPPSFSHHQAITTTIRIGSKFCFCRCPIRKTLWYNSKPVAKNRASETSRVRRMPLNFFDWDWPVNNNQRLIIWMATIRKYI